MTRPPRLRAAIVGAGLMGRWHGQAATRLGAQIVGIADPDRARAGALARRIGAEAFPSLDALLARERVHVVHVCAPLAAHVPLTEQALAAGAHAIVEKPLTPDAATTQMLLAQARARGRLVVPVHQFLFQRGVRSLVDGILRLGPLVLLEHTAATAGAGHGTAEAHAALVADILPHSLALFERIAPGSTAASWTVLSPHAGELRALAEHEAATIAITITTRGRPTVNTFTAVGESATAHVDLFHGFAVFEPGATSRRRKLARPFAVGGKTLLAAGTNLAARALEREPAYPGLRELVRTTYMAISRGAAPPVGDRETLAVAQARDAILRRLPPR